MGKCLAFFFFLVGGVGYVLPTLGFLTKYLFWVMDKQCGDIGDIIELHIMEDGRDGGYLAEFAALFMMPWLIVLPVPPFRCHIQMTAPSIPKWKSRIAVWQR